MKNIIVWGKNTRLEKYISKVDDFISVEDGFIRSVGLGGDLYPPLSLLFDKKGIHYDASKVSDLEDLLQNSKVNYTEKMRAQKILNLIIKLKISKYNLKITKKIDLPENAINKVIIGVLGQVESDNSIIYGVPDNTIQKTNFALVEKVRKDYPDAFIIYKPHPDTESGLRAKGERDSDIGDYADLIASKTSLEDLFNKVDRIAVFTSLGGFEALIRGISVITYGLPFYSGWGLTEDKLNNHIWAKRRKRRLTVEELTFISLIKYPFYSSIKYNCLTEIENIVEELLESSGKKNLEQIVFRYWGNLKDQLLRLTRKMIANHKRPYFKKKVLIEGNCLFLMGPIGTFFARLSSYLEDNNVRTYKILFPLHEYGFSKSRIIRYDRDINIFKNFLRETIVNHEIKHIFMYGNVLIPHKQALDLARELNKGGIDIKTHIFELGYLRPNFVTLENEGINYNSSLIKSREFYSKQDSYSVLPLPKKHARLRIRKIWKTISFINHSLKNYKIVEKPHKLQPKPIYIWFQIKGFFLKYFFFFTEHKLKKNFLSKKFFLVILQVSTDSQLTEGSDIKDNKKFIYKVIKDFGEANLANCNLVFKHHPRDRGYTNYSKEIKKISKKFGVQKNVFYIIDMN